MDRHITELPVPSYRPGGRWHYGPILSGRRLLIPLLATIKAATFDTRIASAARPHVAVEQAPEMALYSHWCQALLVRSVSHLEALVPLILRLRGCRYTKRPRCTTSECQVPEFMA